MEYPSLDKPKAGALRFNTDSSQLEIYDGNQWTGILATSPEQQTGGTRALFIGSDQGNMIDYINISTTGNAADFGDIYINTSNLDGSSDRTRAVFSGGYSNEISKLQIDTLGNSSDFGDLTDARGNIMCAANRTRGLFMGGYSPNQPGGLCTIDYVTIQSVGNAVDFGDIRDRNYEGAGMASPVRAIATGGDSTPGTIGQAVGFIDSVIISTLGNAVGFGEQHTFNTWQRSCASNAVRGLILGGYTSPDETNRIEYISMSSAGKGLDFGDLTSSQRYSFAVSSSTRVCRAGGYNAPANTDIIDYVQIMTTGNAMDFGNLTAAKNKGASASNGHGGL